MEVLNARSTLDDFVHETKATEYREANGLKAESSANRCVELAFAGLLKYFDPMAKAACEKRSGEPTCAHSYDPDAQSIAHDDIVVCPKVK
jgi:hypothetical protein